MSDRTLERALIDAVSACVHYQEYIDTGESFDLISAKTAMEGHSLRDWIRKNKVMLPVRRDGLSTIIAVDM